MNAKKQYKIDKILLTFLLIFATISIITISSAQELLPTYMHDLALKQALWYIVGFFLAFLILRFNPKIIDRYIWWIYSLGVLSLLFLLIFGEPINEAKCWFKIPGIGTIQPSEFMKIIIMITLSKMLHDFHKNYKNPTTLQEFIFLLKVTGMVLIPSILTFLEPDTGVVFIYLLITITMLFIGGIRFRWFLLVILILSLGIGLVIGIYFLNNNLFIQLFGTDFFLRIDRLLDWTDKTGYQLENGLSAIGAGGLFGYGYKNTPIYFPEPQTDFIFAVFASNFGFIGSFLLIGLLIGFDSYIIYLALKSKKDTDKYLIAGITGMLLYQQFQNIGMTFGLLPITGITLPFISYGGSSLLSYMIIAGILLNISNHNQKT